MYNCRNFKEKCHTNLSVLLSRNIIQYDSFVVLVTCHTIPSHLPLSRSSLSLPPKRRLARDPDFEATSKIPLSTASTYNTFTKFLKRRLNVGNRDMEPTIPCSLLNQPPLLHSRERERNFS